MLGEILMDTACLQNIEPIAKSVFSTMLSIELERQEELPPSFSAGMIASVQITGKWLGGVSILFSPESITAASAAMMMSPPSDVSEADKRDVAAELVNMIGGNFKSLLPTPVQLSLPTTNTGDHLFSEVHGASLIDSMTFHFDGHWLQIQVFESTAA